MKNEKAWKRNPIGSESCSGGSQRRPQALFSIDLEYKEVSPGSWKAPAEPKVVISRRPLSRIWSREKRTSVCLCDEKMCGSDRDWLQWSSHELNQLEKIGIRDPPDVDENDDVPEWNLGLHLQQVTLPSKRICSKPSSLSLFPALLTSKACATQSWWYTPMGILDSSKCVPISTIRPSCITRILSAFFTVDNLCAMIIVVRLSDAYNSKNVNEN